MPNDDLISRKALIEHLSTIHMDDVFPNWWVLTSEAKQLIGKLGKRFKREILYIPAVDAVEVVRCKDCAHYHDGSCEKIEMMMDGYYSGTFERKRPIDFCSQAEKKGQST